LTRERPWIGFPQAAQGKVVTSLTKSLLASGEIG
jgi:hypothetical protein